MVQKFFKDKELNAARAEKAREANLRKIALNCSREIKTFWGNAQKLFEWRVKQKLERKRKEALDQHLNFIVDKTEKYSTLLAESLAESASGQVGINFRKLNISFVFNPPTPFQSFQNLGKKIKKREPEPLKNLPAPQP